MSLIDELKRRNVIKVAAAYLVVGWLLIQVASTVAPQLNLPEWAPRLVTFFILLGFPITLVLAWVLDVTPEGIKLDKAPVGTKRMIAVAAILAVLAVGWYWKTRPAPASSTADARSIAVLPFVNMSEDKSNEYFSDGISEEILNVLARVADLRVAARTSSFSFRAQEKEVPLIGRELNVRMVLEGSVRKQGERVRVTAQLIDASNGYHVWSQTYDRDLKDIFAIQDEIAGAIASELKLKLDTAHAGGAAVAETTDLVAYQLYLKGMGFWTARGEQNLLQAEALFQAALKRDPNYAKAWAGLALTYAILPEWSSRPLTETRPAGRDAAEHALALDRDLPEPYTVLGYLAGTEFRFATARAMFQRSIALAPSYMTAYQWAGETMGWEGDLDAGVAMLRKALALDPKSSIVNSVLAAVLIVGGHDDEALALCDSIVAVEAEWCPLLHFDVAMWHKDYARARNVMEKTATERGPQSLAFFHAMMDTVDGKGDANAIAIQLLDLPDGQGNPKSLSPLNGTDAMFWFMAIGRNDLAVKRFARYVREIPYNARSSSFDPHLATLHCEPEFLDILRGLKVEEPNLAIPCNKAAH
ncbi:MAG TPA: tetratricopeptide repeat protein [Rhodanobacteraceae bacterium]|nr:tetratricopeptide repeat protein [Rhodanobacteraceae bacterium]